jgi:uncharacterized protein involved in exopolysaccharide biosynthesis
MSRSPSMTIWDYYLALYRYKFRAAFVVAVAVFLGFVWIAYAPRQYESEAKLFVRVGWENAGLDPTVNKVDAVAINISRETEISTMLEHLRSRPILENTMNIVMPMSPNQSPEARERAFAGFKSRISITSPKMSMVIRIAAKGDTPEQAQKTVATLTRLYLDDHLQLSRPEGSYDFLVEQLNRLRDEFEMAQAELRDAKNRGDLASILGRRNALESQINVVQTKINEVTASLSGAEAKMIAMTSTIDSLPAPLLKQMVGGAPNDGLAAMRDKLFQLQVQQEEARSKYQAAHPKLIALKSQVEEIAALLKEEDPDRPQILQAILAADSSTKAALLAQKKSLQGQLLELRDELMSLNENEIRVTQCEIKLKHAESKYMAYSAKTEDARIDSALLRDKISNVQVIQPASMSVLPISPQKSNILLTALMFGVSGGTALALFSDQQARIREAARKAVVRRRVRRPRLSRVAQY